MNIENWLNSFIIFWKNHDIEWVLSLFTSDIEYWETPFVKIENFDKLRSEWEYIKIQDKIKFNYELFSWVENFYTIKFNLSYTNLNNNENINFNWIYLVKLNSENKCFYFFQCWENN